jgi:four helix bundle protein
MSTIKSFEEMEIWQLARELAQEIFEIYTTRPEFAKDYKLKDQVNSSSGSIMDNVAEGFERGGRNEFIQFLSIAKGSAGEVKSQLHRMLDRKYISQEEFDKLYSKATLIGNKIGSFMSYLKTTLHKGTKFKDRQEQPNTTIKQTTESSENKGNSELNNPKP